MTQLSLLLRFRKNEVRQLEHRLNVGKDLELDVLDLVPQVRDLVSEVISFRATLSMENSSDGAPEGKMTSKLEILRTC